MSKFAEESDVNEPHAFIQWKGTDVCMDFTCECGAADLHFDGYFAYVVQCPNCLTEWEMPVVLLPRKRGEATFEGHKAVMLEADDDA